MASFPFKFCLQRFFLFYYLPKDLAIFMIPFQMAHWNFIWLSKELQTIAFLENNDDLINHLT